MRLRGAEDGKDLGERRLGAGTQVQGFDGHPHPIDSDHRNNSRIQEAKSSAAPMGQAMFIVKAPRRSSTSMRSSRARTFGAGATATGTNSRCTMSIAAASSQASLRHP